MKRKEREVAGHAAARWPQGDAGTWIDFSWRAGERAGRVKSIGHALDLLAADPTCLEHG